MNNTIKKLEFIITILVILFLLAIAEIFAALILFVFYNDSVQKMSNAFAILCLGIVASLLCYMAIMVKNKLGYDDSLDAFGIHGIGGITGAVLLTFFIRPSWMADAAVVAGGSWSIWNQLWIQVLAVLIAIVYAAVMTYILLYGLSKFMKFRSTEDDEMAGLDRSYHGERGYGMLNPS